MYQHIEYIKEGPKAIIRFNRPQNMNCIGPQTHVELVRAWGDFAADDDLKVAILTGSGSRAFCAGGDLKAALKNEIWNDWNAEEQAAHEAGQRDGFIGPSRWTHIYKPIIAAVNGAALAGGLEWACFADIRIAEEHATFGVACRRWNIGLGDGGTQRLPRIVGLGRAMDLILTGRVIDAHEALDMGLVNEIVPEGKSLDRARSMADHLCTLPQPAMRTDKEAVYRGLGKPLDEGLKIEASCFFKSIRKAETQKGLNQFNNRSHPDLR